MQDDQCLESDGNLFIVTRNNSKVKTRSCSNRTPYNNIFHGKKRKISEDSTHQMFPDEHHNSGFCVNSVSNRSKSSQGLKPLENLQSQMTPSRVSESNLMQTFRPSKDTIHYTQPFNMHPDNLFQGTEDLTVNGGVYKTAAWPKSPDRSQNTEKISLNQSQNYMSRASEQNTFSQKYSRKPADLKCEIQELPPTSLLMRNTPEFSNSDEHSSIMFQNNIFGSKNQKRSKFIEIHNSMDQNVIFPNNSQQIPMVNSFNIKMKKSHDRGFYKVKMSSRE